MASRLSVLVFAKTKRTVKVAPKRRVKLLLAMCDKGQIIYVSRQRFNQFLRQPLLRAPREMLRDKEIVVDGLLREEGKW